jgi:hypothetical protein
VLRLRHAGLDAFVVPNRIRVRARFAARGVETRAPRNTKSRPGAIRRAWGRNPGAQKHNNLIQAR